MTIFNLHFICDIAVAKTLERIRKNSGKIVRWIEMPVHRPFTYCRYRCRDCHPLRNGTVIKVYAEVE